MWDLYMVEPESEYRGVNAVEGSRFGAACRRQTDGRWSLAGLLSLPQKATRLAKALDAYEIRDNCWKYCWRFQISRAWRGSL